MTEFKNGDWISRPSVTTIWSSSQEAGIFELKKLPAESAVLSGFAEAERLFDGRLKPVRNPRRVFVKLDRYVPFTAELLQQLEEYVRTTTTSRLQGIRRRYDRVQRPQDR